jgi:hypothetical protein
MLVYLVFFRWWYLCCSLCHVRAAIIGQACMWDGSFLFNKVLLKHFGRMLVGKVRVCVCLSIVATQHSIYINHEKCHLFTLWIDWMQLHECIVILPSTDRPLSDGVDSSQRRIPRSLQRTIGLSVCWGRRTWNLNCLSVHSQYATELHGFMTRPVASVSAVFTTVVMHVLSVVVLPSSSSSTRLRSILDTS